MHTCRKWRRIVFATQAALHLRLFCTHGTPVQKGLDCWPTLPIVVHYEGLPALRSLTPEDEDNIMAALKHSDRVISINLVITTSLLEKLSTIEGAFSELQDLVLLSREREPLTMPSTFRWGQRLRRLHSTGIAFSAFLQPLYSSSSTNLIDLQLHDAFLPWQFSPVNLKNVLSEMIGLRSLSLHFRSIANYHFPLPPYEIHAVLPVLTRLNYRGSMMYLEGILTIIDAPSLKDIEITSDDPFLSFPKFKTFVDRIEMYRSYRGTHILSSHLRPTVSISLTQPGAPMHLKLQLLCKPIRMHASSLAQICFDSSPFLFNDKGDLCISITRPPIRMNNSHSGELLEILNQFTGKKLFDLDMNHSITVMYIFQS